MDQVLLLFFSYATFLCFFLMLLLRSQNIIIEISLKSVNSAIFSLPQKKKIGLNLSPQKKNEMKNKEKRKNIISRFVRNQQQSCLRMLQIFLNFTSGWGGRGIGSAPGVPELQIFRQEKFRNSKKKPLKNFPPNFP